MRSVLAGVLAPSLSPVLLLTSALVGLEAASCPAQDASATEPSAVALTVKVAADRPAGPALLVVPTDPSLDPLVAAGTAVTPQGTLVQVDRQGEEVALRWVAERPLTAGTLELRLELLPVGATPTVFRFEDTPGRRHLLHGSRRVYVFEHAFEPARDQEGTYKPFHEIAALHDDGFVTKGAGGHFTHHRGLFVGWNKTQVQGGGNYDFWHCRDGASQRWKEHLTERAGPVCADSVERVDWCAKDGAPVVHEVRSITAWQVATDRHLFDVAIELWPAGEQRIALRGDPQHAGFQFRAAEDVHQAQDDTVYVRPDSAHGGDNDVWQDLGWAMIRYRLRGQDYDVVHVSHPENPGPSVYSTRAYGRFGSFQEFDLEPGKSVVLRYRVVVARRSAGVDPATEAAAFQALALTPAD